MVERAWATSCAARWRWVSAPPPRCKYERIYPATVNSAREAEFAADVAASLVGRRPRGARTWSPAWAPEDFSFMLQVKPGAYLRIGQGGEGSCFLHNSRYDFNDDILPLGAALHASLVEQSMPCARLSTQTMYP
jgi:metal-dependent amidase/aminoacylase/carboxypeptidase family protein